MRSPPVKVLIIFNSRGVLAERLAQAVAGCVRGVPSGDFRETRERID
jgi:hypothetical protein